MFAAIVLHEPRTARRARWIIHKHRLALRIVTFHGLDLHHYASDETNRIIVANLVSRILEFWESGFAKNEHLASARLRVNSVYWNISDVNRQAMAWRAIFMSHATFAARLPISAASFASLPRIPSAPRILHTVSLYLFPFHSSSCLYSSFFSACCSHPRTSTSEHFSEHLPANTDIATEVGWCGARGDEGCVL